MKEPFRIATYPKHASRICVELEEAATRGLMRG